MISDEAARHEACLVRVNLFDGPWADATVDQVSVHFAVSVH